jgi:hypothetical protein
MEPVPEKGVKTTKVEIWGELVPEMRTSGLGI